MIDILFTTTKNGPVTTKILGATDTGIRLYQKIIILLLSSANDMYRQQYGSQLPDLVGKVNISDDITLQNFGVMACSGVLQQLDPEDRAQIQTLTATAQNLKLYITISLRDGTTYTGALTI